MSDSHKQEWTETIESNHSLLDLNLKEVWRYKDLVYMFVKRDFVSSFKQTILVPFGSLLIQFLPLLFTLSYLVVSQIFLPMELQKFFFIWQVSLYGIIFLLVLMEHPVCLQAMRQFLEKFISQDW